MIEYSEMRKIVEENSTSKNKVDNVEFIIGRYNNIMDLKGKDRYIWYDWITQTCSSLSDLEQSIAVEVKEYTSHMFELAYKMVHPERLDLPSAYAAIAKYIRENKTWFTDEEFEELDMQIENLLK